MSRASQLASLRLPSCALGARLFPPSKWAGLFPSAAYRRSAPPQLAWGILTPCGLGCLGAAWKFCSIDEWADSHFPCWRWAGLSRTGWDASVQLGDFAREKVSAKPNSRWPFLRAMRPVAEWRSMPYKQQGAASDPRAARPVAERR